MDHALLAAPLRDRCTCLLAQICQASDRHHVAAASLAICAPMRHVARDMLQANIALET